MADLRIVYDDDLLTATEKVNVALRRIGWTFRDVTPDDADCYMEYNLEMLALPGAVGAGHEHDLSRALHQQYDCGIGHGTNADAEELYP